MLQLIYLRQGQVFIQRDIILKVGFLTQFEFGDGNSTTFSTKSAIPGKKKKVMTEEGEDSNSTTTDVAKNKTDGVNEDPSSF